MHLLADESTPQGKLEQLAKEVNSSLLLIMSSRRGMSQEVIRVIMERALDNAADAKFGRVAGCTIRCQEVPKDLIERARKAGKPEITAAIIAREKQTRFRR